MGTKVIPVHKLKIGMFVEELDRSWLDTPFLFHKKKIRKQADIDSLIENGIKHVTINTDKGLDVEEEEGILNQAEREHLTSHHGSHEMENVKIDEDPKGLTIELPKAQEVKNQALKVVKDIFQDVRLGKSLSIEEAKTQVKGIVDSVFRNRDALLCLLNIREYDNYTFIHSVNVCILAVSFGRHLGFSREEIENLGLGALLHDIGKTKIPESILNKPGKFTEEEYNIMKKHVELGVAILSQHKEIPEEAMLVAWEHHEKYNGSGYPRRLYGDKISLMGQIGGISDFYDATTYDRVYHKGASCHSVVRSLYEYSDILFKRNLIERFIQCIGIYPFGSFVELNTGHCGIVVSVNHNMLLRPQVLVMVDEDKRKLEEPRLIDLSEVKDEQGYVYHIEGEADPTPYNIDVERILREKGYYPPPPLM